jgi:hypothetical protein
VSAFVLLGGPGAAAAFADQGDSHSDSGRSSNKDGTHGRGGSDKADADDANGTGTGTGTGNGNGGNHHLDEDVKRDVEAAPRVRVGSGRDDQQWLAPGGAVASDVSAAPGVAIASDVAVAGDDDSGATGATGPDDETGSDRQGAPVSGFTSPRVTFGNGRTPGAHTQAPEPDFEAPAPQPEPAPQPPPPPPPAPAPHPSWVNRIATPPAPAQQMGVTPAADWSDPLWGVAGLLLIPAAGATLGYRQARAAQAVDRLHRA